MENTKVIDYYVISTMFDDNLAKTVNQFILEGWQPFGGVSISDFRYSQVMVKYEGKDDGEIVETDKVIIG